jgi:uncharacterized protein (DUF433 family)
MNQTGDTPDLLQRITIDPEICHGKPVIRGLRYTVESMLEYLAGGDSIEDLLAEFPDLERDDLLASSSPRSLSNFAAGMWWPHEIPDRRASASQPASFPSRRSRCDPHLGPAIESTLQTCTLVELDERRISIVS